ncbi:hypothetical protein CYMTET_6387 [Cymbomonas tetramitiformis]|uniref:SAM domain-containing protein n=1 Tax=Cymbomonas tetramitiformis TaxID=36881 RepID=A0AAE0GXA1_9CHLO|nr:hypothetical protein CYMTET_6387 [Cymbomonas tetramitiformis]|eukprot:gene10551-12482_t
MGNSQSLQSIDHGDLPSKAHERHPQYSDVNFTEKAVWAIALENQLEVETYRAILDVLSLGVAEISRLTAGNAYHWFFVCRGKVFDHSHQNIEQLLAQASLQHLAPAFLQRDLELADMLHLSFDDLEALGVESSEARKKLLQLIARELDFRNGRWVYFVAQFGNSTIGINSTDADDSARQRNRIASVVADSIADAARAGCGNTRDPIDTWIKFPSTATNCTDLCGTPHKYPLLMDVEQDDSAWKKCEKPRTLAQLEQLADETPAAKHPYTWDGNNCQHFAKYLFERGYCHPRGKDPSPGC